jgi:cyclopropane-fatty-acyl-phospholipid synthase
MRLMVDWAERGWLPDSIIRSGVRQRLAPWSRTTNIEKAREDKRQLVRALRQSPIALATETANAQHYELPPEFFTQFLGSHHKYSSCLWSPNTTSLDQAEEEMLALTTQRAEIQDGQRILELGCGWGSLTLWIAQHFPNSHITGVSNSHSQREFIEAAARRLGLTNVHIVTADINHFQTDDHFDRVVSVECFEHLRNYDAIFARIAQWLSPDGRCLLHIFCHREFAYTFDGGPDDWMGEYFFQSGLMPSEDLFGHFNDHLRIIDHWRVSGRHYAATLNAWLAKFDASRPAIAKILENVYPDPHRWMQRWRMFFMTCAELFGYANGNEWFVAHYLMTKTTADR